MTEPEVITSATPASEPTATEQLAQQLGEAQQSPVSTPEEANAIKERMAFETYVNSNGEGIPENFKDAGAWFDSLKEAQSNYTQGQQEISEMRSKYEKGEVVENPNYVPPTTEAPEAAAEAAPAIENDELRIPTPTETTTEEIPEAAKQAGITEEMWDGWGQELATRGSLSQATRSTIKETIGFTDRMIDDYVLAQKSRLRESFTSAANLVGGEERLNQVFDWASKNLSPEDQNSVNIGLSSEGYEVTLRGLNAMYESATSGVKNKEPSGNPNLTNRPSSEPSKTAYKTRREFTLDRSNPAFNTDPRFRQAVESRMMITDWNNLPY
jgi:hypothetical protein